LRAFDKTAANMLFFYGIWLILHQMFSRTDQLGNTLHFETRPRRIVSLVPSQSELLWDLGLREELVGITKFCIHPEKMFKTVERVGGTKQLDIAKILALKPDLVIGNKEENERAQIEALQKECKVWMSNIYTFEDSFDMMLGLGEVLGKETIATELVNALNASLAKVENIFEEQRAAYFIWNRPYMLAAKNTFIDHVLSHLGLVNAAAELERYPEIDVEALKKLNPDLCLLSSEPFPFKEKHVKELLEQLPQAKILVVDGEVFSWYGSRLLHLEGYVKGLRERI
jgi:ABC-type Fe3+-hydroxamate transport system substrate-binding protein